MYLRSFDHILIDRKLVLVRASELHSIVFYPTSQALASVRGLSFAPGPRIQPYKLHSNSLFYHLRR